MKNLNVAEKLELAYNTSISKLFWIGASIDNDDLEEILQEFYDNDKESFEKYFPELIGDEFFEDYLTNDRLKTYLYEYDRLGFLAEILVPAPLNISFKENKPISWSTGGTYRVGYCYGETPAILLRNIQKKATQIFNECVKAAKKK